MSRAILADAVALVRGDRYLTYDFTPFNLTTWGYAEANRNVGNAAWRGVLGRLIARGLPRNFNATSVYTHFPLITPKGQKYSMDNILTNLGLYKEYTYDKPVKQGDTLVVTNPKALEVTVGDRGLVTPYVQNIQDIGLSPSFLTVIDDTAAYARVTKLVQDTFVPEQELSANGKWFYEKTLELIGEKSFVVYDKAPRSVDIVKDVLRLIPVHWAAKVVRFCSSPLVSFLRVFDWCLLMGIVILQRLGSLLRRLAIREGYIMSSRYTKCSQRSIRKLISLCLTPLP